MVITFVDIYDICLCPMAAHLFLKSLADKGIGADVEVYTAGVACREGAAVHPKAVEAMRTKNIDITDHISHRFAEMELEHSDYIVVPNNQVRNMIWDLLENKRSLITLPEDLAEPIGGDQEAFNKYCDLVEKSVEQIVDKFDLK